MPLELLLDHGRMLRHAGGLFSRSTAMTARQGTQGIVIVLIQSSQPLASARGRFPVGRFLPDRDPARRDAEPTRASATLIDRLRRLLGR